MTIEEYFGKWVKVIDMYELDKVVSTLNKMRRELLCPNYNDIFKAFHLCPYDSLKVVMIGQDPYPQKGVATGILFGNNSGTKLSPSLEYVRDACVDPTIPYCNVIFDPTLERWAEQGILMLNSSLTTELNKVGSHTMIWRPFMTKLMEGLSEYNTGIIYVLFGEQAKTLKPYINKHSNMILEEKHPAYYARQDERMPSTVFKAVEELTKGLYKEPIKFYQVY